MAKSIETDHSGKIGNIIYRQFKRPKVYGSSHESEDPAGYMTIEVGNWIGS
jgi:hypothetical protein